MISVVILSHNKIEYTRICIESLLESDCNDWELIVVDNGSQDGTVEYLKQLQKKSRDVPIYLVLNDSNIGCSTARNLGAKKAKGEWLVFCDNDIALRSVSWLNTLQSFLEQSPHYGMVGPKILYPFAPFDIQCAGAAVTPKGRVQFMGRGESKDDPRFNSVKEVQCLISACCMIRHELFDAVGGFDEVYNPVEFEDIDLCYKVRAKGYSVWYTPEVEMYHFENVTTEGTDSLPNTYLIVKNGMTFKKRWRYMFEKENGPAEADAKWKHIPAHRFSEITNLKRLP
jgi:GT2 family glycosyltransferase